MLKILRSAGVHRTALFSALLVGFVLALILAAAPELHEELHHGAAQHDHQCLAKMIAAGGCDDARPAPPLPAFAAVVLEVVPPAPPRQADSLFLSFRILEHAPPRRA